MYCYLPTFLQIVTVRRDAQNKDQQIHYMDQQICYKEQQIRDKEQQIQDKDQHLQHVQQLVYF